MKQSAFCDTFWFLFVVYDENQQLFILNFRGLSFSFPVDSKFQVVFEVKLEFKLIHHFMYVQLFLFLATLF